MTRPENTPATPADKIEVLPAVAQRYADTQDQLSLAVQQQESRVRAVALQVGYEGSLAVGALEDEIRFYQRRTVEAILETGKRLRVLKEMTPHGEFAKRVELLGFSYPTAARFMQAAEKTAKSLKLRDLSDQVKNGSAFLELVTHDDDELQALDGMDDVDRMSASQLRAKFRDLKAEKEAVEKVSASKNEQIDALRLKVETKLVAATDWPEAFKVLHDQAKHADKNIKLLVGALDAVREEALKAEPNGPDEEAAMERARAVLAEELLNIHRRCAEYLEAMGLKFNKTLGGYASEGLWK
jgi:Zn finger protein HypA/HybF involved in hydrogenase expression